MPEHKNADAAILASRRDYFAAAALSGLVVNENVGFNRYKAVSAEAFAFADAMLKEEVKNA